MAHTRRAYDDAPDSREMYADCRAVETALHLPARRTSIERTAQAAARPAPSLRYEDQPRESAKPEIDVSDAAARLGTALDQHLE